MRKATAIAWMLLSRLPGLPRHRLVALLNDYPDPEQVLSLPEEQLQSYQAGSTWLAARRQWLAAGESGPEWQRALRDWAWLQETGAGLLPLPSPAYPALLREIHDPPPLLYFQGNPQLLDTPLLAIVGSRRASRSGLGIATQFGASLAKAGMGVTSGLALGIDAAAHRGALQVSGTTIAVLGCGLDIHYPPANRALQQQIAAEGLLLSELPPGSAPLRPHFPQRNRIISGLSLGVLVVEASPRSGSLITARVALEQNREVFAIPGSIHNPASRGCNSLIRQGALLVDSVADILEALHGWTLAEEVPAAAAAPDSTEGGSEERRLLELLGFEPISLDELIPLSGQPISNLLPLLTELEMRGLVEQVGGCWLRCR